MGNVDFSIFKYISPFHELLHQCEILDYTIIQRSILHRGGARVNRYRGRSYLGGPGWGSRGRSPLVGVRGRSPLKLTPV